jgi:RNA polymerase sigma factor (sigma-70 family)
MVEAAVEGERRAVDAEAALEAIAAGDTDALEWLYRELRVPVFAVALAITTDRGLAEDVLQETFLRVHTHARTYRPGSRPRAWVVAIARNLAVDAVRSRGRERPDEEAARAMVPAMAGGEDRVLAGLNVTAALLALPATERQIVVLHAVVDLTHAEIARALGLPAGTVRWRYRVALGRLETVLKGVGMAEREELTGLLRAELERATPEVWPRLRRRVEARRIAAELLVGLDNVPAPGGRLALELRFRLLRSEPNKAG